MQMALPTIMVTTDACMDAFRPKMSAIWPQNGMKAADVRLKADTIQLNCETAPGGRSQHSTSLAVDGSREREREGEREKGEGEEREERVQAVPKSVAIHGRALAMLRPFRQPRAADR